MNDAIKELGARGWTFGEVYGYAATIFQSPRMKRTHITEKLLLTVEEWAIEERLALIEEKKDYLTAYFKVLGADILRDYLKLVDHNLPLGDKVKMTVEIDL